MKEKLKKIGSLALALFCLGLCACGADTTDDVNEEGGGITVKPQTPVTQVTNDPNDRFTYRTNLLDWYALLNGDWKTGFLNEEYRLDLIAALEAQVLLHYYTVPLTNHFSASLMSYKTDYITYDYNTFMGYGGVRYLHYNYDDAEWAAYVKSQKDGVLNYK